METVGLHIIAMNAINFPKLFPRKGMETFLSSSLQGGGEDVLFPKLFPRKGMETMSPQVYHSKPCILFFPKLFPRKGMETFVPLGLLYFYPFRNYFPVRGWKLLPCAFSMKSRGENFPKLFPRKGMETISVTRTCDAGTSFRNYFPVRGWKLLVAHRAYI